MILTATTHIPSMTNFSKFYNTSVLSTNKICFKNYLCSMTAKNAVIFRTKKIQSIKEIIGTYVTLIEAFLSYLSNTTCRNFTEPVSITSLMPSATWPIHRLSFTPCPGGAEISCKQSIRVVVQSRFSSSISTASWLCLKDEIILSLQN